MTEKERIILMDIENEIRILPACFWTIEQSEDARKRDIAIAVFYKMGYTQAQLGRMFDRYPHYVVEHAEKVYNNPRLMKVVNKIFSNHSQGRTLSLFQQTIITEVSKETGIPVVEILSQQRNQKISYARMICYYIFLKQGYSTTQTGKAFNRDHTVPIYGYRKVEENKAMLKIAKKVWHKLEKQSDSYYIGQENIKKLFNDRFSISQIASKMNLDIKEIRKQIKTLVNENGVKKCPNYKNSNYFYKIAN